jgi:prepilin-type N-terminal cleavage/methylation domain-containing protein
MIQQPSQRPRPWQRGFNLVEVLIAMAIMGSVLLAIVTLFFFGRANVYSGKQMTQAVAVAARIQEDLAPLSRDQIYAAFVLSGDGLATHTVNGTAYTKSVLRDTKTISGSTDFSGYLAKWNALMSAQKFMQGTNTKVSLIFQPTLDEVAPNAEPASPATSTAPTSQVLRIRAVIQWDEGRRNRNLILDTVKTVRRRIPAP